MSSLCRTEEVKVPFESGADSDLVAQVKITDITVELWVTRTNLTAPSGYGEQLLHERE